MLRSDEGTGESMSLSRSSVVLSGDVYIPIVSYGQRGRESEGLTMRSESSLETTHHLQNSLSKLAGSVVEETRADERIPLAIRRRVAVPVGEELEL